MPATSDRGAFDLQDREAMAVSEATVQFHAANLRLKTGAANRAELTALAISLGLAPKLGPDAAAGGRS